MPVSRPSTYLNWIPSNNPSYITQPSGGQLATGWTANERPPYQYMNWVINLTDAWIQWFDSLTFSSVGTIDSVSPSANGLVIAGGVIYAQSASTTYPGMMNTTTQSFAGNKTFFGQVGVGGTTNASAILNIGATNPLSGGSQYNSKASAVYTAAATAGVGFYSSGTTAATSFTMSLRAGFYHENTTKGAGSTINYDVAYVGQQPTQGTLGNAVFSDSSIPSGSFFLFQAGTQPSQFNGQVTFPSTNAATADAIGSTMTSTGANAIDASRTPIRMAVYRKTSSNPFNDGILTEMPFNAVFENVGGGWNGTSKFVAPVTGTYAYAFNLTINMQATPTNTFAAWIASSASSSKYSQNQSGSFVGGQRFSFPGAGYLHLTAGDQISVQGISNGHNTDSDYSTGDDDSCYFKVWLVQRG